MQIDNLLNCEYVDQTIHGLETFSNFFVHALVQV